MSIYLISHFQQGMSVGSFKQKKKGILFQPQQQRIPETAHWKQEIKKRVISFS